MILDIKAADLAAFFVPEIKARSQTQTGKNILMENIYKASLNKWGEDAQYDQAIEECAELITALKHLKRNKVNRQAVIDELADVTLMLGQLTWMFGEKDVKESIARKLDKLETLLEIE